jgi:small subunit ribosomal protein S18
MTRSKYRTEYPADFTFDYKDPSTLYRFVSEGGKITPARISKLSLKQQKRLSAAIKVARTLALLPVGSHAYDSFSRPENISPVPFQFDGEALASDAASEETSAKA